ncbi:hypothetical protein, partial [Vibrio rotiferianus]|uniref:hypothetical protein n=1 Tax=Vibrio rotiferianus TaxID=190895 RepID=UPI001C710D63
QYLIDCGIDPETGEGEANQDAMKAAMNRLITTEGDRDVFNNIVLYGVVVLISTAKNALQTFSS